jgi:hypothetical protein
MMILAIVLLAAAVYVAFSIDASRRRSNTVHSERAPVHYSAVQIICADCAGDGLIPVRTFVNKHGFCDRCGGSSYVLASTRAAHVLGLGAHAEASGAVAAEGRVLPFETRPATVAPERIAV